MLVICWWWWWWEVLRFHDGERKRIEGGAFSVHLAKPFIWSEPGGDGWLILMMMIMISLGQWMNDEWDGLFLLAFEHSPPVTQIQKKKLDSVLGMKHCMQNGITAQCDCFNISLAPWTITRELYLGPAAGEVSQSARIHIMSGTRHAWFVACLVKDSPVLRNGYSYIVRIEGMAIQPLLVHRRSTLITGLWGNQHHDTQRKLRTSHEMKDQSTDYPRNYQSFSGNNWRIACAGMLRIHCTVVVYTNGGNEGFQPHVCKTGVYIKLFLFSAPTSRAWWKGSLGPET